MASVRSQGDRGVGASRCRPRRRLTSRAGPCTDSRKVRHAPIRLRLVRFLARSHAGARHPCRRQRCPLQGQSRPAPSASESLVRPGWRARMGSRRHRRRQLWEPGLRGQWPRLARRHRRCSSRGLQPRRPQAVRAPALKPAHGNAAGRPRVQGRGGPGKEQTRRIAMTRPRRVCSANLRQALPRAVVDVVVVDLDKDLTHLHAEAPERALRSHL